MEIMMKVDYLVIHLTESDIEHGGVRFNDPVTNEPKILTVKPEAQVGDKVNIPWLRESIGLNDAST
jgi:hypothetical protein